MNTSITTVEAEGSSDPICDNCNEHKGTMKWTGDGGILALTHGRWVWWCNCCAVKAQLEYARERADAIPDLEEELKGTCQ